MRHGGFRFRGFRRPFAQCHFWWQEPHNVRRFALALLTGFLSMWWMCRSSVRPHSSQTLPRSLAARRRRPSNVTSSFTIALAMHRRVQYTRLMNCARSSILPEGNRFLAIFCPQNEQRLSGSAFRGLIPPVYHVVLVVVKSRR